MTETNSESAVRTGNSALWTRNEQKIKSEKTDIRYRKMQLRIRTRMRTKKKKNNNNKK